MRCRVALFLVAGGLLAGRLLGQPAAPLVDPVTDLFTPRPPLPEGAADIPAVLRPPEGPPLTLSRPSTPPPPRRPPFLLKPGDRVLFLGDGVLESEADHGYFETRLESQYPTHRFTFRNLSRSPNNRLRDADPVAAARDFAWIDRLAAEARALRPDVVVLGYGTRAGLGGGDALAAYTNTYARLLETVPSFNPSAPPRLLMLSPLSFDPPDAAAVSELTNRYDAMLPYAQASWVLSTNHNASFVDLFIPLLNEVRAGLRPGLASPRPKPTEDGVRLSEFGARRMVFAWDRALGWTVNHWRFGLMPDGKWRDGGFGALIRSHSRTDEQVQVTFTEERLPTPAPRAALKVEDEDQPHCFIQVRGLKPGLYELRVDRHPVLTATRADWDRYVIICRGPSWDQAEQLRQTIVRKNAAWEQWWRSRPDGTAGPESGVPAGITALEGEIARLKQPVQRTYEIVRIGDAPEAAPAPAP